MSYRNANINERGYIYGKWMTSPGSWTISYSGVYCYLVVGEEKALLIDTAYGAGNLREFVEEITDKPITVVNTHGHFDHTGGNPWWPEVYAGPGAEDSAKKPFSPELQKDYDAKPYPDYTIHTVRDGYIFDLGGRKVEVIEIPAHAGSSIALLDHGAKALYSGDEMEAGQVLLFVHGTDKSLTEVVTQHKANMEKLLARSGEFTHVHPAHNGPYLDPSYIGDYITLAEQILSGTQNIMPDQAGFGWAPAPSGGFAASGEQERAQYGGASFVYLKQ
jgi:glyoxylase-like metal-dependent hydrolase (beta-lactamase superfamily II)